MFRAPRLREKWGLHVGLQASDVSGDAQTRGRGFKIKLHSHLHKPAAPESRNGIRQPEVTAGGNALKYYASVRLDVRRVETLKSGGESIGSHTRVKVVKNKVAPPFKDATFDIIYGKGICREGEIVDAAVKLDIIQKSGSWFSYKDSRLAQGRDNVKALLQQNPELKEEIEKLVRENIHRLIPSGVGFAPAAKTPTEIPIEAAAKVTARMAKAKIDISVDD